MSDYQSISRLGDYLGKKVEIFAFGISYRGILKTVDYDAGTLKLIDGDDHAILDIERVESFQEVEG